MIDRVRAEDLRESIQRDSSLEPERVAAFLSAQPCFQNKDFPFALTPLLVLQKRLAEARPWIEGYVVATLRFAFRGNGGRSGGYSRRGKGEARHWRSPDRKLEPDEARCTSDPEARPRGVRRGLWLAGGGRR